MESIHGIGEQAELLKVVRGVRTRWKLKHALRGAALTLAGTFVVYAITAIVVHSLNYSESSVMAGRIVCVIAFLALAFQFVLDRLQTLDAIAWVREPGAIHVTAAPEGKALLPLLERVQPPG